MLKVSNFMGRKNQFLIETPKGTFLQSYDTLVAWKSPSGRVVVDHDWDYSRTTTKYVSMFVGKSPKEIRRDIQNGNITVTNLNEKEVNDEV